jgi:hypothetical protein
MTERGASGRSQAKKPAWEWLNNVSDFDRLGKLEHKLHYKFHAIYLSFLLAVFMTE